MSKSKKPFGSEPFVKDLKTFKAQLQVITAGVLADHLHTPEDGAEIIAAHLQALAFSIAVVAKGDPKTIDKFCHGAEAFLIEECVEKAKAARLLSFLDDEAKRPS